METGLTRNAVISELTRSPHGKLEEYLPVGKKALSDDGDFYSHLIAWNTRKGQIRDAKVALPVIGLMARSYGAEFRDNSLACLACLDPRNLLRGVKWAREQKIKASEDRHLNAMVRRYLAVREDNYAKWERAAVQHRASMKELYVLSHMKPTRAVYGEILFGRKYPKDSVFAVLGQLKDMAPLEIAGEIITRKIPFLIALGALGAKQKDPDVLMALIERMSPTELVTNMKRMEKLGVKTVPALRAALEQALGKAAKSGANILKTSVAADAVEDEGIAGKLRGLQEKQIEKARTIDGNWLILSDKSGSMQHAIEASRHIAGTLTKFVKGQVTLAFFDTVAYGMDVSGKTYEEIAVKTKLVTANGGTVIGSGLRGAMDKGIDIDGIVIVSDGGDNSPSFAPAYEAYKKKFDKEPTVYFFRMKGDADTLTPQCKRAGIELQTFELGATLDYYSLPALVQTMRVSRYSLVQEIMDCQLLTLDLVLPIKEKVNA